MRRAHALTLVAMTCAVSCTSTLQLSDDAIVLCAGAEDCPEPLICLTDVGQCGAPGSACVTNDARPVADGTPCGDESDDRVCVRGVCAEGTCGDGVVEPARAEECDPGVDPLCHADCKLPSCGDNILDVGESCDEELDECHACVFSCNVGAANCDGLTANGCECAMTEVPLPPNVFTAAVLSGAAFLGDQLVFGRITPGASKSDTRLSLARQRLVTGVVETIVEPLRDAHIASHDGRVFAHVLEELNPTTARARLLEITEDGFVEIASVDNFRAGLQIDDTSFYVSDGIGVLAIARDGGDTTTVIEETAIFGCRRVTMCANSIGCDALDTLAIHPRVGNTGGPGRVAAESEGTTNNNLSVGCSPRGNVAWQSRNGVFEDVDGVTVERAPLRLDSGEAFGGRIATFNGRMIITGGTFGAEAGYLVEETAAAQSIVFGQVVDLDLSAAGARLITVVPGSFEAHRFVVLEAP